MDDAFKPRENKPVRDVCLTSRINTFLITKLVATVRISSKSNSAFEVLHVSILGSSASA